MESTVVHFCGHYRSGNPVSGWAKVEDVAEFVRTRYRRGWKDLTVKLGDIEVGQIAKNSKNRRIWWAEESLFAEEEI